MRTATILLTCALTIPTAAQARPIVWWHMGDGAVEDVPDHDDKLYEERNAVAAAELAVARRDNAIDDRKEDRKEARQMRRDAREDLRTARKDLRRADRNDNQGMRKEIDDRAEAERQLAEAKDYVDLQKTRVHAARERKQLAKSELSRAIAEREYAEAFLVSVHDTKGADWTVPNRYLNQRSRIQDEVLDDERELAMARADVREASQDHWSADDEAILASYYSVPTMEVVQVDMTGAGQEACDDAPTELKRMHFEIGEHHIMPTFQEDLAHNARILRENRDVTVRVEGHTDATGPKAFNLDLAWDRAESVAAALRQMGVWDSQIETVAFGEGRPLIETDVATAYNRRVELRIVEQDNDALVEGTLDDLDEYGFEPIEERQASWSVDN